MHERRNRLEITTSRSNPGTILDKNNRNRPTRTLNKNVQTSTRLIRLRQNNLKFELTETTKSIETICGKTGEATRGQQLRKPHPAQSNVDIKLRGRLNTSIDPSLRINRGKTKTTLSKKVNIIRMTPAGRRQAEAEVRDWRRVSLAIELALRDVEEA